MPTDEYGWNDPPEEILPDAPEDLIGQRIDFAVLIEKAVDLPEDFCKNVFCEYKFYLDDESVRTPEIPGKHRSPVFEYRN